jgi:flagellar basal-body rod protein FlgB
MSTEPLAIAVAARALDGLMMRYTAISQNIANAGSERAQTIGVDFETSLKAAASRGPGAVEALRFGYHAEPAASFSADRRIDLQLADAGVTAARYAAVSDMLARRLSMQASAITGGRS